MSLNLPIQFSRHELRIFRAILRHAMSYDPPVVPRLAGGFVRDRLLGISSADIDVVLDSVSGFDFATGLSCDSLCSSRPHIVKANPDKSKHLETAILSFGSLNIDFASLRTETYANTRIPQIQPGTPSEDASRRDITINSLFFNLVTNQVEDFTGRGLLDLVNLFINTPLNPSTTLYDDPLRILRIFRFKSKFVSSTISTCIYESIKDPKILSAFSAKVSVERIRIEIDKMLSYSSWPIGLIELATTKYVVAILKLDSIDLPTYNQFNSLITDKYIIRYINLYIKINKSINKDKTNKLKEQQIKIKQYKEINKYIEESGTSQQLIKLYAILYGWAGRRIEGKGMFVNEAILKHSLKYNNMTVRECRKIEKGIEKAKELLKENNNSKIIEYILEIREVWRVSLIIAAIKMDEPKIVGIIRDIGIKGIGECYLERVLVRGEMIKGMVSASRIKRALLDCNIIQIEQGIKTAEEIIEYYKGKSINEELKESRISK